MTDPLRALWGALVGDACGATLEFFTGQITKKDVEHAMTLAGGGRHHVGPGQITDDGELSLALWSVLCHHNPSDGFPIEHVAKAYGKWYHSFPFDIGRSCSFAFETIQDEIDNGWSVESLKKIYDIIYDLSKSTEANGAMMRISPIAVWYTTWYATITCEHDVIAQSAANAAKDDARLSHPSITVQDANAVYVYALTRLLLGDSPSDVIVYLEAYSLTKCIKVQEWVAESRQEVLHDFTHQIGHVRHAFVASLWFLRHPEITYSDAIQFVLMKGGDTDTNAAIVGAMVACYQPIPDWMKERVHTFDCLTQGIYRDVAYGVRYQLSMAK